MMSQLDFDCDIKGSVRSIYPTLLSHTVEHYPRLPVMRESTINHSHAITENFSNDNEAASINCQHRSLPHEILCLVLSHIQTWNLF